MNKQVPFLGSKISLISKSQIRYEGTLYPVDAVESTVALQNGKNKKTRENAYNNMEISIRMTEKYLWQTEEIMEILCNGDTSDFERAIILDEIRSPRYYDSDMLKLLRDIQSKLDKMP